MPYATGDNVHVAQTRTYSCIGVFFDADIGGQ